MGLFHLTISHLYVMDYIRRRLPIRLALLFTFGFLNSAFSQVVGTGGASWSGTQPVNASLSVHTAVTATTSYNWTVTRTAPGANAIVTLTGNGTVNAPGYGFAGSFEVRSIATNTMISSGYAANPAGSTASATVNATVPPGYYIFFYCTANSGAGNGGRWFGPALNTTTLGPGQTRFDNAIASYCVEFQVRNPHGVPLSFRADQGGVTIHERDVMPSDGITKIKITGLTTQSAVYLEVLQFSIYDYDAATGAWFKPVGGYTTSDNQWSPVDVLTPQPVCANATSPNPVTPAPTPGVNPDPNAPPGTDPSPPIWAPSDATDPRTGGKTTGTVWNTVNNNNINNSVTNNQFVEGVSKLEKQAQESNARLDKIEDAIDTTNNKLDGIKDAIEGGGGLGPEEAGALAAGQGATDGTGNGTGSASVQASAEDLIPKTAQPGAPAITKSAPTFLVSFPAGMGGGTYDLNPFRADRFGGIIDWFRTATAWSVVVSFALWASFRVKEWVVAVSAVNQAKGNPIIGGTGAQATALVAAGAITVAVSVFLVALVAFLAGDFALTSLLGIIGVNPTTGLWGTSAWMLDRCFPVGIMISAVGARVAWNFYASSIFSVCTAAIRFIVP